MRHENTPELFGVGVGGGTGYEVICDWCNSVHNPDADPDDSRTEGETVRTTQFADKHICDCCFEKIENEVLTRMPSILTWYKRILQRSQKRVERDLSEIDDIEMYA